MAGTYTGQVQNGVIVFEGSPPTLAPGTRVRIELIDPEDDLTLTLAERLKPIIGAAQGLPPDLAEQHDHYIHGTPKR